MTTINDGAFSLLTQLALATDGAVAVAGATLAFVAIRSWRKYVSTSSALERIRHAKTVPISGLSALITESSSDDEKLVIVRGFVQAKSAIEVNWHSVRPNVLVSYHSGAKGVVLQQTQTCVFGWVSFDFRTVLFGDIPLRAKYALQNMVPFVLVGDESSSEYVDVDMDTSTHLLPLTTLTTVYHHLEPVPATPYTFLQALLGHSYPIGLLEEEKLLPLGKEISAVGTCILDDGNAQIRSCENLPYFLSELTKDQMLDDLSRRTNVLFWTGIVLGTVSVGILGYATIKNWKRWKAWIERRRLQQSRNDNVADGDATADTVAEEESEEIPEGQLCVVCLMRRKRYVFIPCGHFVCCQRCALLAECDVPPECPLCTQTITSSLRVYDS